MPLYLNEWWHMHITHAQITGFSVNCCNPHSSTLQYSPNQIVLKKLDKSTNINLAIIASLSRFCPKSSRRMKFFHSYDAIILYVKELLVLSQDFAQTPPHQSNFMAGISLLSYLQIHSSYSSIKNL